MRLYKTMQNNYQSITKLALMGRCPGLGYGRTSGASEDVLILYLNLTPGARYLGALQATSYLSFTRPPRPGLGITRPWRF